MRGDGIAHEHRDCNRANAARNGRDPARDLFHAIGVDISDDDRLAVRARNLIDADINDRSARFHHVGAQKSGFADRDEHGVGPTRMRRNRTRQVMTNRNGRVGAATSGPCCGVRARSRGIQCCTCTADANRDVHCRVVGRLGLSGQHNVGADAGHGKEPSRDITDIRISRQSRTNRSGHS